MLASAYWQVDRTVKQRALARWCIDCAIGEGLVLPSLVVTSTGGLAARGNMGECLYSPGLLCVVRVRRSLGDDEFAETLWHELRHAHQYATGQLADSGARMLWEGKDNTGKKYDARPWEIDANEFAAFMMDNYYWE